MFICAIALSGVAAFYSIAGLIAIFAAAPIPIAIMGSILEGSKLVVASWLYRNWDDVPRLLKAYFISALAVLMFLTSMGIFGFLSKAHMEQGVPTGDLAAQIAVIDEKINTEKEIINAARQALTQLDQQVNETLNRTTSATDTRAVERSIAIRRAQTRERAQHQAEISKAQTAISALNTERSPVAADLRKIEAEVGPIKYIAALIYGEEAGGDQGLLEKAVRWVTILIVIVFDPLAVIMLIAASWSLARMRGNKETHQPIKPGDTPLFTEAVPDPPASEPGAAPKLIKRRQKPEKVESPPDWQIPPPPASADEHPSLVLGNQNWGSRPPDHLIPRTSRKSLKD
jgi:hypothetical protein